MSVTVLVVDDDAGVRELLQAVSDHANAGGFSVVRPMCGSWYLNPLTVLTSRYVAATSSNSLRK